VKALLDTYTFLWWITDDPQLSQAARSIISVGKNEIFLSSASGLEIAIKARLGKLKLPDDIERFMIEQMEINSFKVLPVKMKHAVHVYTLPDYHRDPFDRLLIAQARVENLYLLTGDAQIRNYDVEIVW
jgi:PIN domain nuclease of toxin-antitoxin system